MSWRLLIASLLLVALMGQQHLVNRILVQGTQEYGDSCWFTIRNSEQLLDFRSDCPLGNQTDRPRYSNLVELIPIKKAYLFKRNNTEIRGYRFVKDPGNYQYRFYNFQPYNLALPVLLDSLNLNTLKMTPHQNYIIHLQYNLNKDQWVLKNLSINYQTSISQMGLPSQYQVKQWLQEPESGDKSLARRFMNGSGDDQPVNVTLDLTASDAQRVEASSECSVIIEEILPEWFFISYDDLHTLEKYEAFEIELPAHYSKQFYFRYTVPFSKFKSLGQGKYSYIYSMRVRYPAPADDYVVKIGLHPNDKITVRCGGTEMPVEEDLLFDRGYKDMYAGKTSDTQFVTISTYALSLVLAIWSVRKHKKLVE